MTRPSPTTGYAAAHAASLCLRENTCRCGHSEYDHRESTTPTGSGCTHWLCDGCAEYEKASDQ